METIKNYTDIPQSKALAKILKLESADMRYQVRYYKTDLRYIPGFISTIVPLRDDIPCWSLAALFRIIRETIGYNFYGIDANNVNMSCDLGDEPWNLETEVYDNEVDACVDMIIKLHELNLL